MLYHLFVIKHWLVKKKKNSELKYDLQWTDTFWSWVMAIHYPILYFSVYWKFSINKSFKKQVMFIVKKFENTEKQQEKSKSPMNTN